METIQIDLKSYFNLHYLRNIFDDKIKNKAGKGIDGIDSTCFENNLESICNKICIKVFEKNYRFSPYLEIAKSKGRGKAPRIISKPTVRDKLTLYVLKDILHDIYSNNIQSQLPNTYIRAIKSFLSDKKAEDISFLKIDIKGFYDNLSHEILFKICMENIDDQLLTLIRRAIKNKTVPRGYHRIESELYKNAQGVPQGLSISNILASIYMEDFDQKCQHLGHIYFRYVDDILIFCEPKMLEKIEDDVKSLLGKIGLETNDKTERGSITSAFEYLGYKICGNKISVRCSTVERFIKSVIAMFTDFKHNTAFRLKNSTWIGNDHIKDLFVLNLNEKITGAITENKRYGWIFYFIEINDMDLLHKIDSIISDQFSRLELFGKKPPNELKTLVRSYYYAKYNTYSGYIHNYSKYESITEKISFLIKFGYMAPADTGAFTEAEVLRKFERAKTSHLMKLDADIGNIS